MYEFEVLSADSDNASLKAPWCSFSPSALMCGADAVAFVRKFLSTHADEILAIGEEDVVVCRGEFELRGMDFEALEPNETLAFPKKGP